MLQLFTKLHFTTTQVTREEESGERGSGERGERGVEHRCGGEEGKGGGIRVKLK